MKRSKKTENIGDLDCLTSGERWLITRRRLGLNQAQMSKKFGWSATKYKRIEWDEQEAFGAPEVNELSDGEKCHLYRRRSGMLQRQVARDLGVSRLWVNKMERGLAPADQLLWFWEH